MSSQEGISNKFSPALNIAAYLIIIGCIMYASAIITPLLLAFFISIICAQPIQWMQKRKVPQGIAILLVFVFVISLFIGLGEMIGSSLSSFSENEAVYEKNLREMSTGVVSFFNDKGINLSFDKVSNLFDPSKLMGVTAGVLSQLGGFMSNSLTILFLVFFLLFELDSIQVKVKAAVKGTTDSLAFIGVIIASIRHYLSIKTLTSFITGLTVWIALSILGLDYAILWALIAFLLNYIPTIGSILAAVPAVLFALIQLGFGGALSTIIIFAVVNMVIGNVVEPKMMGKGMGLSTFVVFFSLLFWGFVLGTVGMFLSIPLTMTIKVILEQNPNTKSIAIFMGTQEEAQTILDNRKD